eukprot:scaffold57831_cov72-Phaeocystis_antarctica.AAC.9
MHRQRHRRTPSASREAAKSDVCPSGPRRFGHAVAHKTRRRLTQVRKPAEASGGDLVCSDSRHVLTITRGSEPDAAPQPMHERHQRNEGLRVRRIYQHGEKVHVALRMVVTAHVDELKGRPAA